MKMILSSRRHHYVARVSIFLLTVVLIAGVVGCGQPAEYTPMVAAGSDHTVGLKSDGTVVAVGYIYSGQCEVGNWTGITQVAAGEAHTVGLKSDGTVVAVGNNYHGQCAVSNWTDITQVAAGGGAGEGGSRSAKVRNAKLDCGRSLDAGD
ncbi:MAG: hypothetical protein MUO61_03090, partial [Dehalococcoidia bacterium]|nr:hypothetical protein [Dehalococcoidia bacterium]